MEQINTELFFSNMISPLVVTAYLGVIILLGACVAEQHNPGVSFVP
jgi:hypothetical protein